MPVSEICILRNKYRDLNLIHFKISCKCINCRGETSCDGSIEDRDGCPEKDELTVDED